MGPIRLDADWRACALATAAARIVPADCRPRADQVRPRATLGTLHRRRPAFWSCLRNVCGLARAWGEFGAEAQACGQLSGA